MDPGDAAETSCAYRLYPDSGSLCYGLGLSEDDLAHAQTHPHAASCDRVRCQSGRYFLGTPPSGREVWWDATRSVLSLPKSSMEPSSGGGGYEITSYHGAIHGEALGSSPQPSVSENAPPYPSPRGCHLSKHYWDRQRCLRRLMPACRLQPSVFQNCTQLKANLFQI